MAIATTSSPPIIKNAHFRPATNAPATAGETASKLGSTPLAPIVATTTVVAMAMLTTLAEFRTNWVNADATPYWDRSTALSMELLFGELNKAVPVLCTISMITISNTGEDSVRVLAKMNQAVAERIRPPTVSPRHPKRSDHRPLKGPNRTMHNAGGISRSPTSLGPNSSTRYR